MRGTCLLLTAIPPLSWSIPRDYLSSTQAIASPNNGQSRKETGCQTVVPIFTQSTRPGGVPAFITTAAIAVSTPCWMSDVVAVLCHARTLSFWSITLHVCQQATDSTRGGILTCQCWFLQRRFLSRMTLALKAFWVGRRSRESRSELKWKGERGKRKEKR